jgi:phosphoribosylamine--glycine ligase
MPHHANIHSQNWSRHHWYAPLVAGTSGVVLIVVGLGQTMKQAQAQVYSRIKNVLIPNMYYRTDIGERWDEDSDRLHNWGVLR